jgi:hypothetical protein
MSPVVSRAGRAATSALLSASDDVLRARASRRPGARGGCPAAAAQASPRGSPRARKAPPAKMPRVVFGQIAVASGRARWRSCSAARGPNAARGEGWRTVAKEFA